MASGAAPDLLTIAGVVIHLLLLGLGGIVCWLIKGMDARLKDFDKLARDHATQFGQLQQAEQDRRAQLGRIEQRLDNAMQQLMNRGSRHQS